MREKRKLFRSIPVYVWVILIILCILALMYLTEPFWRATFFSDKQPFSIMELSDEEKDQLHHSLLELTTGFSSPAIRPYASEYFGTSYGSDAMRISRDFTQMVKGKIIQISHVEDLDKDWQSAYVVWIEVSGKELIGLYRGSVDHLQGEDEVLIEGVYVPSGEGLLIDWILPMQEQFMINSEANSILFWIAAGLVAIWTIYVLFRLLTPRSRVNIVSLVFIVGLGLFSAACSFDIVTVIDADGKGFVMTKICDDQETFEFLRKMPGFADYLSDRIINFRAQGGLVDDAIDVDEECLTFQNPFSGLGDISNFQSAESETRGWVFVDRREMAGENRYRLIGVVDTTIFYDFGETINSTIQNEMENELNKVPLTYTVVMPGRILYHNADDVDGRKATWNIDMNSAREIVIESTDVDAEQYKALTGNILATAWNKHKEWIIVIGITILSTLLFLCTLRRDCAK